MNVRDLNYSLENASNSKTILGDQLILFNKLIIKNIIRYKGCIRA